MTPISVVVATILFMLRVWANKKVQNEIKKLVLAVENRPMTGDEKNEWVKKEFNRFFDAIVPIVLTVVIEMFVMGMQAKSGEFEAKLKEIKDSQ